MPDDPSTALWDEVSRLIQKWGETAVVNAVEAARTRMPRGPKPSRDDQHLMRIVSIMLRHGIQRKCINSDEAVRIYIDRLSFNCPKKRVAMMKRLRRKTSENWMGVMSILIIFYEACIMGELTEGHARYLFFVFSNWWALRKASRDPAEIAKFWRPDGHFKTYFLAPFRESRFSVYDL